MWAKFKAAPHPIFDHPTSPWLSSGSFLGLLLITTISSSTDICGTAVHLPLCIWHQTPTLWLLGKPHLVCLLPQRTRSPPSLSKRSYLSCHIVPLETHHTESFCVQVWRVRLERSWCLSKMCFLHMMKMYVRAVALSQAEQPASQHHSSNGSQNLGISQRWRYIWYFLLEVCWPSAAYDLRRARVGSNIHTFKNSQKFSVLWASILELL